MNVARKQETAEDSANEPVADRGHLLVVDDEETLLRSMHRILTARGFSVEMASNGREAKEKLDNGEFNVIISDISMPHMNGIELLREVRAHDLDVPVILVTGEPTVDTAVKALELGALHYLAKPVDIEELQRVVEKGVRLHRMALMKRQAMELSGKAAQAPGDLAGLEASFDRAMDKLWIAYQPIVMYRERRIFGFEALMRSDEPNLPHPGAILEAAERLDALWRLGRIIRHKATIGFKDAPEGTNLFVNLHPQDLMDDELMSPDTPLAAISERVILEVTERSALDDVSDVRGRMTRLREMGYRIAIDDLGAGYAGLTSFATLEPEIVKLDMGLVRDVHKDPTKKKLIGSMAALCRDMGMIVVAEGIEVSEERDVLDAIGCELLQGFLLAKPGRPFPDVNWGD